MVQAPQKSLAERPPGAAVVDGTRREQQPGCDRIHRAGPSCLRSASQADERDARDQGGGDHPGMKPATQPRFDRVYQVDDLFPKSGNRVPLFRPTVTPWFAGQPDFKVLCTP